MTETKAALALLRTLNPSLVRGGHDETATAWPTASAVATATLLPPAESALNAAMTGILSLGRGTDVEANQEMAEVLAMELAAGAASASGVKEAIGVGLTVERRRKVMRACQASLIELQDEMERAVDAEAKEAEAVALADAECAISSGSVKQSLML